VTRANSDGASVKNVAEETAHERALYERVRVREDMLGRAEVGRESLRAA
jgi:hypothetical protein